MAGERRKRALFEGNANVDSFILLGALLLILGVVVTKFSTRLGVPSLILFIILGMLMGNDGFGIIDFQNVQLAQTVGIIALIIILFEGGTQTRWRDIRPVVGPSVTLATFGVLFTAALMGVVAKQLLDLSWLEAMLLGATVGSTDAAAVFAALKGRSIDKKMGSTLEAESGSNDPMAVFLTLFFIELILADSPNVWLLSGAFFWQMGAGLAMGALFGWAASWTINRINLDSSGLYPLFAIAFALLTYSVTSSMSASGFLAVYVAALMIGNSDLIYRQPIYRFNEGMAWMSQISMFIILGLLAFPRDILTWSNITMGLILSAVLMFLARPLATFLSTSFFGYKPKQNIFLSWAGLRGAVPIILATYPIVAGVESGSQIFNVVFFIVLTSALIQGATIAPLAKWLHLSGPLREAPTHSLELVSLGKANAEIMEFQTNEATPIVGQTLQSIEFPASALISAIVRDDELVTPVGETVINAGDYLYILVSRKEKRILKQMLRHDY